MDILNTFADDVLTIDISIKSIDGVLDFCRFTKLEKLDCNCNNITNIINLPVSIQILICGRNQINKFDNLPRLLRVFHCDNNQITKLENLPNSLEELICRVNCIK